LDAGRATGLALIGLGAAFVVAVFILSIGYLQEYESINISGGSLEETLSSSADVLLEVLVKIAFLGVALAAGSVLLSKGIGLLHPGRSTTSGGGGA
jgi:uncharacterized membrane protein (Fun14 family)